VFLLTCEQLLAGDKPLLPRSDLVISHCVFLLLSCATVQISPSSRESG